MAKRPVKKSAVKVEKKIATTAKTKKKPWPSCSQCKKPSVLMRRDSKGNPEHYCVPHWNERPGRNLKPSKHLTASASKVPVRKIKKKVKVKK